MPVLLCHFTRGVDRSFHHPSYISPGISKLRAQSRMLFCACYHCFPCAYVMVRFDPAIQLVTQTKSCTLYVRTYSHTLPNFRLDWLPLFLLTWGYAAYTSREPCFYVQEVMKSHNSPADRPLVPWALLGKSLFQIWVEVI